MKIYLAGAISGLTFEQSEDWRDTAKELLKEYDEQLVGFSPLRQKHYLKGGNGVLAAHDVIEGSYDVHPLSTSKGIVARDYHDVTTSAAVLVNLLGAERVSIGTVMEIAFAWEYRIPLVLVCEEDNIHWKHPFISEMVAYRVDTLQDGVDVIASILLP